MKLVLGIESSCDETAASVTLGGRKVLSDVIFINNGEIALCDTVDNIRLNHGMSVDEYFREVFK